MRCDTLCALTLLLSACSAAAGLRPLGPFGGSAAVVEVDAQRGGALLAATSNALLFRSTDAGDNWTRVAFPAELRARLHAFVIAPTTGDYLVALSDETSAFSGLFRSADGGQSWTRLPGLGRMDIWAVAVWPLNGRVIAAGTTNGVFLSRDAGETWSRISPQSNRALQPVVSLAFDIVDSRILYAGTPHLPWKTADGGQHWTPARTGMMDDSDVFSILVDETRPLRVFATACSGIYRSTDRGVSWIKILDNGDASSRTYQIAQDAASPDILFAGTANGLLRSVDRGKTWRRLSNQPTRWIAFDRTRPGRIYLATDEFGLFRSDDRGETLTPINDGFCNRRILSVAAAGDTLYAHAAAASGGAGIYRKADGSTGWEKVSLPPQVAGIAAYSSTDLYAATPTQLLSSSDKGHAWTEIASPTRTSPLTALLAGPRILAGTEAEGIYFTDDGGVTWSQAHLPAKGAAIRSLVALSTEGIAAVTRTGLLLSGDGAEYHAASVPEPDAAINGIVATARGLLAATSHGLISSNDHGTIWRRVPGALDGNTVSALGKHPTHPGVLFAAQFGAIYQSQDDGQSWTPLRARDGLQSIQQFVVTETDPGTLLVVSPNQGVYALVIGATSSGMAVRK